MILNSILKKFFSLLNLIVNYLKLADHIVYGFLYFFLVFFLFKLDIIY